MVSLRTSNRSNRPLWRRLVDSALLSAVPWVLLLLLALFVFDAEADTRAGGPFLQRGEVREYIAELSESRDLDKTRLNALFASVESQQSILDAIATPAERRLNWGQYRPIFLNEKRIVQGRAYLNEHAELFARAEEESGVPASVIAAIIGVETFYGRITGKHKVLESLATLAFDYPPRATFFRSELTEFIALSDAEGWDTLNVKGSYAGAMGLPQFISSSYREYSVDFDGDGQRDLFGSVPDVIGSVANYLKRHGWQRGRPIGERWPAITARIDDVQPLLRPGLKPEISADRLRKVGFDTGALAAATDDGSPASVMVLEGAIGPEVWVGYDNFYSITRYNHSALYALAVMQLASELEGTTR